MNKSAGFCRIIYLLKLHFLPENFALRAMIALPVAGQYTLRIMGII